MGANESILSELKMTKPFGEDDEFWALALMSTEDRTSHRIGDDEGETYIDEVHSSQRLKTYSLPCGITLAVSSLPQNEGIMSPLGAQAWHASSLLAAHLVLHKDELFKNMSNSHDFNCLELGCGSVGLSGMTLAAVLNGICCIIHASVWLTDLPDDGILDNLRKNVIRNEAMFPNVTLRVEPLDWVDFTTNNVSVPTLPPLDLVIGSELVYTEETAVACAAVVTRLLQDNPNLLVVIIQVMDRPGFETNFLPLLQKNFDVRIQQPLDAELHEAASRIVASVGDQLCGTLDRFAFGSCWIKRRKDTR